MDTFPEFAPRIDLIHPSVNTIKLGKEVASTFKNNTNSTAIWHGFEQTWGYNHRWNRFGNYARNRGVGSRACVELRHGAASGIGPDRSSVESRFSIISSKSLKFLSIRDSQHISTDQGQRFEHQFNHELSIPSGVNIGKNSQLHLLLNGWDLKHIGKDADKPIAFELHAGTVQIDHQTNKIEITYNMALHMDCRTPECIKNDNVDYQLDTDWLIVAGPPEQLSVGTHTFPIEYSWSVGPPASELQIPWQPQTITALQSSVDALPAFKGVSIKLSRIDTPKEPAEQHMLVWRSMIKPGSFKGTNFDFELGLMFKNWAVGQKQSYPPFSAFSDRRPGHAQMSIDIALLQTKESLNRIDCTWTGAIHWSDITAPIKQGTDATAIFPTTTALPHIPDPSKLSCTKAN